MLEYYKKHKWCSKCCYWKLKDQFYINNGKSSKDGLCSPCISCCEKYNALPAVKAKRKAYDEGRKASVKAYRVSPAGKAWQKARSALLARRRAKKAAKRAYKRAYDRDRRRNDPVFKLMMNIRSRINEVLRGKSKSASTLEYMGSTPEYYREHLEKQFKPGMTGDNTHIDHIVPCAFWNPKNELDMKRCFNWRNVQPLFAKDNMSKGGKMEFTERQTEVYSQLLAEVK